MLHHHRHHHHPTSCKAWVEHLHLLQQDVPQKMTPLAGLLENYRITYWSIFHPQKMIKRQHKNVECACEKISRNKPDFFVLSVVFLCVQKAATHDIRRWNITETKFQVFISYSFHVIIFLLKSWKKEPWTQINGWHFNSPGYLNSWQRMC